LRIEEGRSSLAEHGGDRMEAKLDITTTSSTGLLKLPAAIHNSSTLFGL
jgi:hypothetical protein